MTERKIRRYSGEERAALLQEWERSGELLASFANRHGLAESTLYGWTQHAKKKSPTVATPQFVEVAVTNAKGPKSSPTEMTLELPNGFRLRFLTTQNPEDVIRFARALQGTSC